MGSIYDVIIIGAGPAGITAAIYLSRSGKTVALIEKALYGGTLYDSDVIENYPSHESISGFQLAVEMEKQVRAAAGVNHLYFEVDSIEKEEDLFTVIGSQSETVSGRKVIAATGIKYKKLEVEGENDFFGKGVSNCAVCDGSFLEGKTGIVIGGGDTAVESALYLSNIAKEVVLVHRGKSLRAQKISQDRLFEKENISIEWNANTSGIKGEKNVEGIWFNDGSFLEGDGVFVNIGMEPVTHYLPKEVLDEEGFVVVNPVTLETDIEGLYGIGDVRSDSLRQIVNATADGSTVSHYINK